MDDLLYWHRARAALQDGAIEVASLGAEGVAMRHCARPDGPVLTCSWNAWGVFLMGAIRGDFDRKALLPPTDTEGGELAWRASS